MHQCSFLCLFFVARPVGSTGNKDAFGKPGVNYWRKSTIYSTSANMKCAYVPFLQGNVQEGCCGYANSRGDCVINRCIHFRDTTLPKMGTHLHSLSANQTRSFFKCSDWLLHLSVSNRPSAAFRVHHCVYRWDAK